MTGVNLHYQAAETFARAMASNVNLTVQVDDTITTAATDGRRLLIRPYEPHWQPGSDMDQIWYGLVAHECFHNLEENRADLHLVNKDERLQNPLFHVVHNVTIDHNIERRAKGRWQGADMWIRRARTTFNQLDRAPVPKDKVQKSATCKLMALSKLDAACRNEWQGTALLVELDEQSTPWYDKIKHLRDEYEAVRTGGRANLDLSQKIYDLLELKDERDKLSEEEQRAIAGSIGTLDDHTEEVEGKKVKGRDEGAAGKFIDGEGNLKNTKAEANANPEPEFQKTGYKPLAMTITKPNGHGEFVLDGLSTLSKALVKRLQIYSRKKFEGGKKRGKLNRKRLVRAVSQGDQRVFRRKYEEVIKDTAVLLLVDCSGSMHGNKYQYAAASALSLIDVLDKNQISVGAYGFTYSGGPVHIVFKDFNDRAHLSTIDGKFNAASSNLRDNSDGDNVLHCYQILKAQPQKRKVMIVLSDGRPCAPPSGCGRWAKDVIKSVDNDRQVELYGIGICDEHVEKLYRNAAVINNPRDLEPVLLNLLETIIIN